MHIPFIESHLFCNDKTKNCGLDEMHVHIYLKAYVYVLTTLVCIFSSDLLTICTYVTYSTYVQGACHAIAV